MLLGLKSLMTNTESDLMTTLNIYCVFVDNTYPYEVARLFHKKLLFLFLRISKKELQTVEDEFGGELTFGIFYVEELH
jgi:hypothetical protein